MAKKILWLDNDPPFINDSVNALREQGYEVTVTTTVMEAEALIRDRPYDLLILDVMIPTKSAEEEAVYEPDKTSRGYKTGLVFYRRMKDRLAEAQMQTLVLGIKMDKALFDEFVGEGVKPERIATKFALRDIQILTNKIKAII